MLTHNGIFSAIKSEIVGGRYNGGQTLDAAVIASKNSSSGTCVHEALLGLCCCGLVDWTPQQGFIVARVSRREAELLYGQMRSAYRTAIRRLGSTPGILPSKDFDDSARHVLPASLIGQYDVLGEQLDRSLFSRSEQSTMDLTRSRLWFWRNIYLNDDMLLDRLLCLRIAALSALDDNDQKCARHILDLSIHEKLLLMI